MTTDQPEAHPDWCAYHHTIEPEIPGAPSCFECWHQFESDQDLLDQDIRVRKEFGQTDNFPTSVNEVFCCPFCAHDL